MEDEDETLGIPAGSIVTLKVDFERPSKPQNPNEKVLSTPHFLSYPSIYLNLSISIYSESNISNSVLILPLILYFVG